MTNKKYRSYYKQIAQIMASHVDQQIQQLDTSQPVPISKEMFYASKRFLKRPTVRSGMYTEYPRPLPSSSSVQRLRCR